MRRGSKERAERRQNSEDRKAVSAAMTPRERLEELDLRLGKGIGARKERAKLQAKL